MAVGFDLIQAVIAQLEANTAIQALFGDTWNQAAQTGTSKFFADLVDQVPLPYCQIEEGGESYEFMTASPRGTINFTSPGQMMFNIWASSRASARLLGFAVAQALNDAPLQWPAQNNTMVFRMSKSWFIPVNNPSGPGVPIVFHRAFVFDYEYSASLQIFS
jgi:hypothetical protein